MQEIKPANVVNDQGDEAKDFKIEDDSVLSAMIKDLADQLINNKVKVNQSSEMSFMDKYLIPAIRRVLLNNAAEEVIYSM